MATIDSNIIIPSDDLSEFLSLDKKQSYTVAKWKVEKTIKLALYKNVVPALKYVNGNPYIVMKLNEKGKPFFKVVFDLEGSDYKEYDVSYEITSKSITEGTAPYVAGDILNLDTVEFCIETKYGNKHLFVRGEVLKL